MVTKKQVSVLVMTTLTKITLRSMFLRWVSRATKVSYISMNFFIDACAENTEA